MAKNKNTVVSINADLEEQFDNYSGEDNDASQKLETGNLSTDSDSSASSDEETSPTGKDQTRVTFAD
jgi:hypothetical protein